MGTPAHQTTLALETIDSNLLILWGCVFKNYNKGEYIFHEGHHANFYHQVVEGRVKLMSDTSDGKEFIQGFFSAGQCFGEVALLDGGRYAASAITDLPTVIIRLHQPTFFQMLKENFEVHIAMTKVLAHKLESKATLLKEVSCNTPEQRILTILDSYKTDNPQCFSTSKRSKVDFTRQEIAGMSGLRVETVIRAMRHLHDKKVLTIEHGKVYY